MTVVDFEARFFADMLGAVLPATSTDKGRVALSAVHFDFSEAGAGRVWATDSYRLHSVEVDTSDMVRVIRHSFGAFSITRDDAKALHTFAKNAAKANKAGDTPVGLTANEEEGALQVSTLGASATFTLLSAEAPKCASILAMGDTPAELPALYCGSYMADLFKSAEGFADKGEGVYLMSANASKPARVEASRGSHRFVGVLMPQRQPKR